MTGKRLRAAAIVFAKPARVEGTRLARRLGAADAAIVHGRLLTRTLRHLAVGGVHAIAAVPPDAPSFRGIAERAGADIMVLPDGDAGARLGTVLRRAKAGAVLIDSDTPGLDAVLVRHAAEALGLFDLVVGPNWSGGTYLIGVRAPTFAFRLFEHVRWNTRHMIEDLLDGAPAHWRIGLLPVLADAMDSASLGELANDHAPARRRSSRLGLIELKRQ